VSGSEDHTLRIWELDTGKVQHTLTYSEVTPRFVAMSADGSRVAMSDGSNKIDRWELGAPRFGGAKMLCNNVTSLTISPDGKTIVTCSDGGTDYPNDNIAALLDFDQLKVVGKILMGPAQITAVAFSPDGQQLGIAQGTYLVVYRDFLKSNRSSAAYNRRPAAAIRRLTFSADGQSLMAEGDKSVRGYRTSNQRMVFNTTTGVDNITACFRNDTKFVMVVHRFADGKIDGKSLDAYDSGTVVKNPDPMPPGNKTRLARPDAARIADAQRQIQEKYKEDYAKTDRTEGFKFAHRLRQEATKTGTGDDPVLKFAYMMEARNVAATHECSLHRALVYTDELIAVFDIDALEERCTAVELSTSKLMGDSGGQYLGDCLAVLQEAILDDRVDIADRLLKACQRMNSTGKAFGVYQNELRRLGDLLRVMHGQPKTVKDALQAVSGNPNASMQDCQTAAWHHCLKDDWAQALPLFARGSDAGLKDLAAKDLANPEDAMAQKALGDAWAAQADKLKDNVAVPRAAFRRRAFMWYQIAGSRLTGKAQTDVETRMRTLVGKLPELQSPWSRWSQQSAPGPVITVQSFAILSCCTAYRGPMDIRMMVKSSDGRFHFHVGDTTVFLGGDPNAPGKVKMIFASPTSPARTLGEKDYALKSVQWYSVRLTMTERGSTLWIDDEKVLESNEPNNSRTMRRISLYSGGKDTTVEFKNFTINSIP
jgi:hypothetical protein